MKCVTPLLGAFFMVLGLLHPSATTAQSVKPADVVGTWEGVAGEDPRLLGDTTLAQHTLTIWPDSTWEEAGTRKGGTTLLIAKGRWRRLSGDTISWAGGRGQKIVLQDKKMLLYSWQNRTKPVEVYQRVGSPKPPSADMATHADSTQPSLTKEEACAKLKTMDSLSRFLVKSGAVKIDTVEDQNGYQTTPRDVKSDSATLAIQNEITKNWDDAMKGRNELMCRGIRYAKP